MATQQTQSSNGHDKQYDFAPVDYDAGTVPPRIGAGRYDCVAAASARPTKKDNLPMLVIEWTAQNVVDGNEDNEAFVGASLSDFLVLSEDTKFRNHKVRLRTMLERMGLSFDLVPRRIENKGDLDELINAITGQTLGITVTHSTDKQSGEQRENIEYRLPREESGDSAMEAAPAAAPARGGKPAAKAPAKKTARR